MAEAKIPNLNLQIFALKVFVIPTVFFFGLKEFSETLNNISWQVFGREYQGFQMNCLKQDKIKMLEIKILEKGKKQDIPN